MTASSGSLASGTNFVGSGYAGNENITGTAGVNAITTGGGADTITGGLGADTMTGGAGADTFAYLLGDNTNGDTDTDTISVSLTGGVLDDIFNFTGLLDGVTTKDETVDASLTVDDNSITVVNTGAATDAGVGFADTAEEVYDLFLDAALTAIGSMVTNGDNAIIITAADETNSTGVINIWYVEEVDEMEGITVDDIVELIGTFTIATGAAALAAASSAANYT